MTSTPTVDAIMWPDQAWSRSAAEWRLAEQVGVGRGWVYDHLNLQPHHERWHEATTHLAAAAATTTRIGLGTMVTTPNFRHPAPSAKAAVTLHDVSDGRFVLGVGAGGPGADSDALGGPVLDRRDRMSRFAEWTGTLSRLLDGGIVDDEGRFTTVRSTVVTRGAPGRPPLAVAATGARGMRVAVERADLWITQDVSQDPRVYAGTAQAEVERQLRLLDEASEAAGRDPSSLPRLVVLGYGSERPLASPEALRDALRRYGELGVATVAVLWPRGEDAARRLDVLGSVLG